MSDDGIRALATIIRHRDMVRLNVKKLTDELSTRALAHDLSKLMVDEIDGFVKINKAARENAYGSPEYEASFRAAKEPGGCIALHFSRNSHHPEFHGHERDMGFLDLIEMVLDWKAASDTYGQNTLRGGLAVHRRRFEFEPEQWWLIEQVVDWIEPLA